MSGCLGKYLESDFIPLSALQHYSFCPRQAALIHIEGVWLENRLTAEGRSLHDRVHGTDNESRPALRIVRGLRLHSFELGLVGRADVVEFHQDPEGVKLRGIKGLWKPFPVEYKRGKAKPDLCDDVQLCAQAMCLEEMLGTTVGKGALFYGLPRRRKQVELTEQLRQETIRTAGKLHDMFEGGKTPPAGYNRKCRSCSLFETCMPKVTGIRKDIDHYISKAVTET